MGLFQHKQNSKGKSPILEVYEDEKNFFDEDFRAEIRDHARSYFEKIIHENVVIFKQDLEATTTELSENLKETTSEQLETSIAHLTVDLKDHIVKQLDGQFTEYTKSAKAAQDEVFSSLKKSADALDEQHKQLANSLQKSLINQHLMLEHSFQDNMKSMASIKEANETALEVLNRSVAELKEQNDQMTEKLEQKIAAQEESMIKAFEGNMAQVIEHYLLDALSDQYDLKAQLPAIIKQMETHKDAIVEDMKL